MNWIEKINSNYRIILASVSPRRRQLLSQLDVKFTVNTDFQVDETPDPATPALEVAPSLARRKAEAYRAQRHPDDATAVVTADTVVVVDDLVLGKPANAAEAQQMLRLLSGRTHKVVTGVCLLFDRKIDCRSMTTEVTFARLSDDEIRYYIERFRPFDKAGAYGIQQWIGSIGITGIRGDYYNVVGLPLHLLYTMLREAMGEEKID